MEEAAVVETVVAVEAAVVETVVEGDIAAVDIAVERVVGKLMSDVLVVVIERTVVKVV